MRILYNILIISILYISNAWSQDNPKDSLLERKDENIEFQIDNENLIKNFKEVNRNLNAMVKSTIINRNFRRNLDSIWQPDDSSAEDNPIQKKKNIIKTYSVDSKDRLTVTNQHGDIKVELWDKNEIKVDITIIGYGTSEANAQRLIDNVDIAYNQVKEEINIKTMVDINSHNWVWGNNWSWNGKKEDEDCNCPKAKKGIEINYLIYMPHDNALRVSNKYGKIIIPQFDASLKVNSDYGSFTTDRLNGSDKEIYMQYGSGNIKRMDNGSTYIYYSKLNVGKADNLKVKNIYGSITLDDINNLDGTFEYSSGKIGKINETGKLSMSYSDGMQLSEISKTLKNLDIRSNYTAVKLPVNGDVNADFEVTTTYANFRYPVGKVTFTVNPDENDDDDRKAGWQSTKIYKGKIGKGSGTKIMIKTNYAGVKFMEK